MKTDRHARLMALLLGAASACALLGTPAAAQERQRFDIRAQDAAGALNEYARQAGVQIVFPYDRVRGKTAPDVQGDLTRQEALAMLTEGMGLAVTSDAAGMVTLREAAQAPQSGSAAGDGAEGTVEALIVTAQKREEDIQDVPIAISAFTQEALEQQKIEGGFDLLKAIPNVTFSKNNFTSYNFSIRGIGTKAVSATTDPGVAVSFNNIALIQNRLFEQEYFDVERVEVLRGPQGTLYGRNATAGVINIISAKPDMDEFKGWVKGEVGNYDTKRVSAMVNLPLLADKLAVRFAGALTDRQGYDYNSVTDNAVNGRNLWSTRVTLAFTPTDGIRSDLIWERFEEDDDRSRTGKQLCHRDPGLKTIRSTPVAEGSRIDPFRESIFSQGCKPGSLYDSQAFGTPNGLSIPFIVGSLFNNSLVPIGPFGPDGAPATFIRLEDPYGNMMQSPDFRVIASLRDPVYRAQADLLQLNFEFDLGTGLTLTSQTAYNEDGVYSFQDFNRFNTVPIFNDTSEWNLFFDYSKLAPGGYFCDPQIGCSNTLAGFDISQAKGRQFAQELRLQSDLDAPVNFSVGANYTKFDVIADYYVMYNLITAVALMPLFNFSLPGSEQDPAARQFSCNFTDWLFVTGTPAPIDWDDPRAACPYIDPNPVESINGEGHNYFRSKNPYRLSSAAAFGEIYWNLSDQLKLTAGLRYTDDRKTFIPVPSQVLLSRGAVGGGTVNRGYPEKPAIKQHWGEWTGRLGMDWTPELSFSDQTMVYAFFSRGYKGGGANPPSPGFATKPESLEQAELMGMPPGPLQFWADSPRLLPILKLTGQEYEPTFKPEFVNAYEIGAKNTFLAGGLTFNASAFIYDYNDYQVSQIRDRTAVNENFDAKVWGLEFETAFAPTPDFRMIANLGYLDTRVSDGMKSIDIMNRTQGDPDWTLVKSWLQLPSNCIVPTAVAEEWVKTNGGLTGWWFMCGGLGGVLGDFIPLTDPATGLPYDVSNYPKANGGSGFYADLSGNELPNSPHWTANIGAQYGVDFAEGWRATVRGDVYWQSQSWARIFNAVNDKLHGWYNANLSLWIENDEGLKIELYAKNILDEQPITDAFINSDDTALTTNVFTLDPRLIGLSIRQEF